MVSLGLPGPGLTNSQHLHKAAALPPAVFRFDVLVIKQYRKLVRFTLCVFFLHQGTFVPLRSNADVPLANTSVRIHLLRLATHSFRAQLHLGWVVRQLHCR